MREPALIASVVLAAAIGVAAGFIFSSRAKISESTRQPVAVPSAEPTTRITGISGPSDADTPVVAHPWNGPEKAAALRRVEMLAPADAEYLCFALELIPRDEVFDNVNIKGRLVRYINATSDPSDLRDFDNAFRQMARR